MIVCVFVEVGGKKTDNTGVTQFLSKCISLTFLLVRIVSRFCVTLSQKLISQPHVFQLLLLV